LLFKLLVYAFIYEFNTQLNVSVLKPPHSSLLTFLKIPYSNNRNSRFSYCNHKLVQGFRHTKILHVTVLHVLGGTCTLDLLN